MTGIPGLQLYLSSYQLILRHQCRALIESKSLPKELEAVVKEIWAPRIDLIEEKFVADQPNINEDEGDETSGGEEGLRMFSSQTDVDTTAGETTAGETEDERVELGRKRRKKGERKKERAYPSLVDSLGMCYMAMMVLRLPVSLGDIYR